MTLNMSFVCVCPQVQLQAGPVGPAERDFRAAIPGNNQEPGLCRSAECGATSPGNETAQGYKGE